MAEEFESEPESKPDSVTPTSNPRSSSRGAAALPVVALVVAAAALGLTGWMWFHPPSSNSTRANTDPAAEQLVGGAVRPQSPEAYTDTQRTDAKTKICEAYITVDRGIRRNTHLAPEGGDTAVGALAIAANWRLSAYDGGQYLLARLEPATPPDLADAIRSFGNVLMDAGAAATAGVDESDPAQAARIQEATRLETVIVPLCE
jgi:hypothetical protein